MRTLAGTTGTWLLAGIVLVAADFWEERDFTVWSDKDVEKMLTDSPWAQQVRIAVGSLSEAAGPTSIPAPSNPDECGNAQFGTIQRHKITIAWTSALPIKQALVRQVIGLGAPAPPESQQFLDQPEPFYAVTLSGLPPSFAVLASMRDALQNGTMLKRKDSEPIVPEEVRLFQNAGDRSLSVIFLFPKTDVITLDDREVELITRLIDSEVKKKFKLADMVFRDQLEL